MHRARRICEHLMLPANGQINLNEVAAAFQYSRGGGILTQEQVRQS
jgi:hypothetical protein